MSAQAWRAPVPVDAASGPVAWGRWRNAAAFLIAAVYASLAYRALIPASSAVRAAAVAAAATAGAAGLAAVPSRLPRRVRVLLSSLSVLAGLLLAVIAAGFAPHLLLPGHWGQLAREVRSGVDGLSAWEWPYRGREPYVEATVLLGLALWLTGAGMLCLWPSERRRDQRRAWALAMILAALLAGLANQVPGAWRAQGVILTVVICAWLWLPGLGSADYGRAGAWLLGAVAGALVLAPALAADRGWIGYGQGSVPAAAASFQWNQLYGPITWSRSTATLAEVSAPGPVLMRVTSLDEFDGLRFLRSDAPPGEESIDLAGTRGAGRWYRRATVTLAGLQSALLVDGGGVAVQASPPAGSFDAPARAADGTLTAPAAPAAGVRYEVVSYLPDPSPARLRRAPRTFPLAYLPYAEFELPAENATAVRAPSLAAEARSPAADGRLVGAPVPGVAPAGDPAFARRIESSPYEPAFALARRLAAGAGTSYDVAERIEHYLLDNYTYDEHPPLRRYPLEAFLFQDRRGYCQQFSGAMTLLLRMDGIPARVGAGFAASVYDVSHRTWLLRAVDAHSWVEVFFAGIGWVVFDPTPPRTAQAAVVRSAAVSKAALLRGSGKSAGLAGPIAGRPQAGLAGSGASVSWPVVGLLLILCLVLTCWYTAGARRLRLALGGDASGAVAELQRALELMGRSIPPGTTLAQLQGRISSRRTGAAALYLTQLSEARYGTGSIAEARPTARARRELRRALGEYGGVSTKIMAVRALPPGMSRRSRVHR